MKRILTSFLAIILATANPIYLNTASAATVDSSYALDNHFSSDPTSMEFSAILDVKIEGSNAEVTFETTKNAVLSVILYDDKGTTVYACGSAEVSAGEKKAIVPIHADNGMPDHFFLRTALLDRETMHPLCSIYESPAWTQGITQIQEPALPAELISCPLNTSGMSGSLELKITPTITSYRSSLYRYTQIRLDYHAAITEFETSAAAEGTFPLSDIPSLPKGASLSFTAACDTAAKLNGSLSGTIGYYILNDSGIHSLTSVPRLRTSPALFCRFWRRKQRSSNRKRRSVYMGMESFWTAWL